MIAKYGKKFDNKAIKRTPKWLQDSMKNSKKIAKSFANKERKNLTKCPMCESNKARFYVNIYDFKYVECQNCQNIYLQNPILNTSELYTNDGKDSHYSGVYLSDSIFFNRVKNIIFPKIKFIDSVVKAESALLQSKAEKFLESKMWLDIGSGGGDCLYCAKSLGYKISGFESDLQALNFSNAKLDSKNIESNPVKQGFLDIFNCDKDLLDSIQKADVVSFFNVLEHLDYPRQTIEFFAKNMKKDSFLVLEVPKHKSLASFANLNAPNRVYRHFIAPFHLNIFSLKSLEIAYSNNADFMDDNAAVATGGGGNAYSNS
ncbi:methyltransferase domain-containing protein [Helicobacter saguini]|uniref:Class I SAM-dependent methyltransferase n=1 Tax=Helicobacter saguini TaxID=1548018 RepID=A0A347VLW8_9HELI|nr:methyltransferase domain-containing protein [Helicobacter saguini]MWV67594.1 methyltransferase domain-containing protein [Helicobacter saguini]TLD92380.1 class I SAM-dependent methyltransferase [Helicobacter saguini]